MAEVMTEKIEIMTCMTKMTGMADMMTGIN